MRTPPRSVRTCRRPHRKRARRREKTGSSRSRRCSCSTSKTLRLSPCKWKEPFPSSTPCCTGNPPQVAGQLSPECHSQQKVVQYFQAFSHFLWNLCPVVQEAMQFCVTVCEFGVANSVSGVRKMLPLVWSTDAAIKDAVVQAYRRLYLNPQGDTVRSERHTPVKHIEYIWFVATCKSFYYSDWIFGMTACKWI